MNDATCARVAPRLILTEIVLRPGETVGTCRECGVAFAGRIEQAANVEQVWRAHESICPGGDRAGEVVRPFLAVGAETPRRAQMSIAR